MTLLRFILLIVENKCRRNRPVVGDVGHPSVRISICAETAGLEPVFGVFVEVFVGNMVDIGAIVTP